jgi:hypothetical protein
MALVVAENRGENKSGASVLVRAGGLIQIERRTNNKEPVP